LNLLPWLTLVLVEGFRLSVDKHGVGEIIVFVTLIFSDHWLKALINVPVAVWLQHILVSAILRVYTRIFSPNYLKELGVAAD
jgi:hypothetical protein